MIWIITVLGLTIITFFVYGSWMSIKWQKENRGESTLEMDNHFYWNVFYSNSTDPRVFVPKKSGAGYTVNFANPVSIILGVILVVGLTYMIITQQGP